MILNETPHATMPPKVWLTSYLVTRFSLETIGEANQGKASGTNILEVNSSFGGKTTTSDGQDVYVATLSLQVAPSEEASFYRCHIALQGNYEALDENLSEDDIEEYVMTDCIDDLYVIAKTYIAYMTSHGVFGTLDIPIIKSFRD